jgi:hypothetical protein
VAVTKIQTFGPREVSDGGIEWYEYYAEAVALDGNRHRVATRGRPSPHVEVQERFREMTAAHLEQTLREAGMWSDD